MKKITAFLIVSLICVLAEQVHSQLTTNMVNAICNAKLLINVNTNSLSVGSTATLFLEITNCSTNTLYSVGDYPLSNASLFLTNNDGRFYKLSHLRSPSWDKSFYHPQSHLIGPNETYGWSLNLKIDKDIPVGNYEIEATRIILASSTNSVNRMSCELKSNPLEIEIK
jgi:hypothetical protein